MTRHTHHLHVMLQVNTEYKCMLYCRLLVMIERKVWWCEQRWWEAVNRKRKDDAIANSKTPTWQTMIYKTKD